MEKNICVRCRVTKILNQPMRGGTKLNTYHKLSLQKKVPTAAGKISPSLTQVNKS